MTLNHQHLLSSRAANIWLGLLLLLTMSGCEVANQREANKAVSPSLPPDETREPARNSPAVVTDYSSRMAAFDYFVLALSWSPDYCAANGNNDPQQCSIGIKLGFVLHGLWPQYHQGYPSNCSTEKLPASVKSEFAGLYPNDSLFNHEWEKHGTCSGLSPADYLTLTQQLKESVIIPDEFRAPEKPFRITTDDLKLAFENVNPALQSSGIDVFCSGSGRFLKEMYICFSREGKPGTCGADVHKDSLKSCQATDFLVRNTR